MIGNIMIIDDSPVDRKIIRKILEKRLQDINLFEAEDGLNIKEKLIKNNIHMCILDIMMPVKDGFRILQDMKEDPFLMDIPVIVCTGMEDKQGIEKALTLGAYDYFSKPLSEEAMKVSLPLKVKNAMELMKRKEEIIYLSYHDELTGLYNRRFFEEEIKRLDTERNLPISIIMGDVNGLKLTNDVYGHEEGDRLLKKVADIMKSVCRKDDIVARNGGDEFIILLPGTDRKKAEIIVDRIKGKCDIAKEEPIKPSVSMGFSIKEYADQEISTVYKTAEDNMYNIKLTESKSTRSSIISSMRKNLVEHTHEIEIRNLINNQKIQKTLAENKVNNVSLFENMQEGLALHEIICDGTGKPIDSRFLDVNIAFENITGLKRENIINKTLLEVLPETEFSWIERFGEVALTGKATHFENYSREMEGYFSVNVFCPEKGKCVVMFFDITENKIRQEEFICTIRQLIALNKLKDKLFTSVTHDIRNPMAAMVNMVDVLEEDYYSNDSSEILHEVGKQVKSTFSKLENLLEWLDSQKNPSDYGNISRITEETVDELRNILKAKRARIFNYIDDAVTILADGEILGMVIKKLFDNAAKSFINGGLVSVQTQQTGEKVIVTVRDTGISIDPDEIKKLLEAKYEGSQLDAAEEKETGLGTLICKESILCNGEDILTDSIVHKSNTFYFSFPSENEVSGVR